MSSRPLVRVAAYYAPAEDDALWRRAAAWLGRDPATNARLAQPDLPDIAAVTADAASYGFHATLQPPMRLRPGVDWDAVVAATRQITEGVPAFELPELAVTDLMGFLALCETRPCPALQALADACVAGLDPLRAAPDEAELARRRRAGLSRAQEAMLVRWGYPYMFSTWFFHLTLTRRLTPDERTIYLPAAEAWFAAAIVAPRRVADICLFTQAAPGAPFLLAERIALTG